MIQRHIKMIAAGCLFTALTGCTSYYKVQDPTNGKTFYTDQYATKDNGAVVFKDLQTGGTVTLQNSEIKPVPSSEVPGDAKK